MRSPVRLRNQSRAYLPAIVEVREHVRHLWRVMWKRGLGGRSLRIEGGE